MPLNESDVKHRTKKTKKNSYEKTKIDESMEAKEIIRYKPIAIDWYSRIQLQ